MRRNRLAFAVSLCLAVLGGPCVAQSRPTAKPGARAWISGTWAPDTADQKRQVTGNVPPWNAQVRPLVDTMAADERNGHPYLLLQGCLPHGMPTLMLIMHNAFEVLQTPGRITMLGEGEGNNLRRIYMDGRKHPDDPDENLFGHSVGHWEGDTLVVDTVGVAPEAWIAISEGVGAPNNGGMHIVERLHLVGKDSLHDDLTIEAPKALSQPWKTTRIFTRIAYDILEGECARGNFNPGKDRYGDSILVPRPQNGDGTIGLVK